MFLTTRTRERNYREWMACRKDPLQNKCFYLYSFDVVLGILQAIEILQCLVQDLLHS